MSWTEQLFRCHTAFRREEIRAELDVLNDSETLSQVKDAFAQRFTYESRNRKGEPYAVERNAASLLLSKSSLRYPLVDHETPHRTSDSNLLYRQRATLMWQPKNRKIAAVWKIDCSES